MSSDDARLPIRTVSALTGVNAVTLRAWERRHGLVRPLRTPKGHRLYTQQQVDEIQRVLALVRSGVAIGQVRAVLEAERRAAASPDAADGVWASYRERMAAAIAAFDEQALESVYEEALSLHAIDRVSRSLLMPVLARLGLRSSEVAGGIAEEHFFTTYLRNKLGARFHHRRVLDAGPRLLVACVPGEHHEIGGLLFALAAHEAGLRIVFLGANVPFGEIAAATRRAQCDAVVLSSSLDPGSADLRREIGDLVAAVKRPVYLGGATAASHRKDIEAAGAVPLVTSIESAVHRINAELLMRTQRS